MIATLSQLTIQYGSRVAVDALDLELAAGEITLLLGPNGAGKSTTLAAIAGAVLPSAGKILVDGNDAASMREHVGFCDQPPQLYEFFTARSQIFDLRGKREHSVVRHADNSKV